MGLLSSKSEKTFQAVVQMVERVVRELGLDPAANRLTEDEIGASWGLMKGSAEIFIFVIPGENNSADHSIQVVSPLMSLPTAPSSQLVLFRRMLELNAQVLSGAAFGIKGDTAIIISDRSTRDLNPSEVQEMILRVGHFADLYDDEFVVQFGGRRHSD